MAWRLSFLLCLLPTLLSGNLAAQMYRWVDEHGKVQYGDQIPSKYNNGASTELNNSGIATTKTARAPTDSERQAVEAQRQKQEEQKKIKLELERKDRALLTAYSNVADIDYAERRQQGTVEQNLNAAESRRTELTGRTDVLAKKLRDNPKQVAFEKEQQMLSNEITMLGKQIDRWRQDLVVLKARFAKDRERYIELTTKPNAP